MANQRLKRKQNNPNSDFYVDSTCINCGTCYWMAPTIFKNHEGQSIAYDNGKANKQVQTKAINALLSCPTQSIGKASGNKTLTSLPQIIEDDVYHFGYHSEKSFGGTPYYINNHGGILIDSPRFNNKTVTSLKDLSGLKWQLLTHKDGIADTNEFQKIFNSKRMIHEGDVCAHTNNWETYFNGDDEIMLKEDLIVIPTPGHTKGSVCYLYKKKFLFTGDHLCFSRKLNQLIGFKNHCWYSNDHLIRSMEKLLQYKFSWILPEHGAPFHCPSDQMKIELKKCIDYLKC